MEKTCLLIISLVFSLNVFVKARCPAGWLQNRLECYLFSRALVTWYEASYLCRAHRGMLAAIETTEENNFLKNEAAARKGTYWLGGMDDVVEGDWRWVSHRDDTPFNFTDWMVGQPDNYGNNQDCMYLYQPYKWKWVDAYCTDKQGYICEKSLTGSEVGVVGR